MAEVMFMLIAQFLGHNIEVSLTKIILKLPFSVKVSMPPSLKVHSWVSVLPSDILPSDLYCHSTGTLLNCK